MGISIGPEEFVSFSKDQRKNNPSLNLKKHAEYLWIKGYSHTKKSTIWIPAQVVSASHSLKIRGKEPLILSSITNGLATGPTKEFALLNGAMELVERDAFMITWLNQITPQKLDTGLLSKTNPDIKKIIDKCEKYRLKLTLVVLPTDAPAHAVCAIVQDFTDVDAELSIGLKAHRKITTAVVGSALEALRVRRNIRSKNKYSPLDPSIKTADINASTRTQYWGRKDSSRKLNFLLQGTKKTFEPAAWENDSIEQHWQRFLDWSRKNDYEVASVDIGCSEHNVSPWHIHHVVIPKFQQLYLNELFPYTTGNRLKSVPEKLGLAVKKDSLSKEPHPFD